jgi:hypothetical protein
VADLVRVFMLLHVMKGHANMREAEKIKPNSLANCQPLNNSINPFIVAEPV